MKILLIQIEQDNQVDSINHGITSIAGTLKDKHHDVRLEIIYECSDKNLRRLSDKINQEQIKLVGISATTNKWPFCKRIAEYLKKNTPAMIIAGGHHAILFPECLYETEFFDGICIGEGEYSVSELLDRIENGLDYTSVNNFWFRRKGSIIKNNLIPLADLDLLPLPDYSVYPKQILLTYPRISFSRGCPFNCSYCSNSGLRKKYENLGKFLRKKSVLRAMEEIDFLLKNIGTKPRYLEFDDEMFTSDKKYLEEFAKEYKKIKIPYGAQSRPEGIDIETIKLLKISGCCRIFMGIETGDENLRQRVLNRKVTDEQIIKAAEIIKSSGIKLFTFNMVGFPGETKEMFQKTINLNRIIVPDLTQISTFYPYRGTELGDYCYNNRLNKKEFTSHYFEDSILKLEHFSDRDIRDYHINFEYYVIKGRVPLRKFFRVLLKKYLKQFNLLDLFRNLREYLKWFYYRFKRLSIYFDRGIFL